MLKFLSLLIAVSIALGAVFSTSANAQAKTVTYCVHPSWVPYEMLRNGNHVGISADYLRLIGDIANIDFQLVETTSWKQSLEFVQTEKCMVVPMLNNFANRSIYLDFTIPYFESPVVMVSADTHIMYYDFDGIDNQVVGVAKNSFLAGYLARYYPNISLQFVDTESAGITALERGEIDIYTGSLLSVNVELNRRGRQDLNITGYAEVANLLRIGVNKGDEELVERLNKAIAQIPNAARVDIYRRWSRVQRRTHTDVSDVIFGVALMVIVAATFIWRRRVLSRYAKELKQSKQELENLQSVLIEKNRMLEFLSSHDSMSNLYNRNFMLHRGEDEVSRFSRFNTAASMILFDFSRPLDTEADKDSEQPSYPIRELARICLRCVREVDIAGRWSADQIIILCPQTNINAAKILAERLKEAVENHNQVDIRQLPFTISLAALQSGEGFTDWYERAARALYLSRREHNNSVLIADI